MLWERIIPRFFVLRGVTDTTTGYPKLTIVLTTLNARYIHASLGLRYLRANMGNLQAQTSIKEFIINQAPADIAEQLLALNPTIIGFGVYIWNVAQVTEVAALLKRIAPEIILIVGGPEVSYEWTEQPLTDHADYLITGAADQSFARLCRDIMGGARPKNKIVESAFVAPTDLALPYDEYTEEDIAHRLIYVEASRGCPFKCEFCLSALDKTAWPFDLERFLAAMDRLHRRDVRHFKFVDRTFNLKVETGERILQFFLDRLDERLFLHFEVIPDRLPDRLKNLIARFPAGSLQFEIGIQTLNPTVQDHISRRQDNAKSLDNLRWLRQHSHAHLHVDLIAGLPGEDLTSFGRGFDQLNACDPHEIQVGILKRLRGAPIARHTQAFDLRFNPAPPYNILSTRDMSFQTLQRIQRFARYWDMIANSGRFSATKSLLLADAPFARFMQLSDWIHANGGQTHGIALMRLFDMVHRALTEVLDVARRDADHVLQIDFERSGLKGRPSFLDTSPLPKSRPQSAEKSLSSRQSRHLG